MSRQRLRDLAVIAAAALGAAALLASPAGMWLRGPSLDLAYPLRHLLFGPQAEPERSHAVVVAIDEATYRTPPFSDMPQAAWPPLLAPVLSAVAAEAAVIGFDVVYPTTLDAFQRGFERDFLVAMRNAARAGKLVLGKVQHSHQPILPHQAQQVAVGGGGNIRALNVFEDPDGIIRRVPLDFATADGGREPGIAAELAQRRAGTPLVRDTGGYALGARRIAADAHGNILIGFNTGPGDVPSYSLADLQACAAAGNTEYFRRHFAGRVVLIGTVLDVEDRRLTSKRLVTARDGANPPPPCILPRPQPAPFARDSLPGVFIHAAAINNLLDGSELREWSSAALFIAALLAALAGGLAVFLLPLLPGLAAALGGGVSLPFIAALLLRHDMVMPWLNVAAALLLVLGAAIAYRFTVADRDKRLIARLFSLYLPSTMVDRMVASGRLPSLGGEEREVTILFSDIAGFTSIAESCSPAELVQALNGYFSTMTAIIEGHGGFVDKYIGDAIVAVFGAPLNDAKHAAHALRAALHMRDALLREPERFAVKGRVLHTRIGLNTGRALIGNIGSPRRFNYTAMGDAVNLAARLEGANKQYGTTILASEATMNAAGDAVLARRIDSVQVVGRLAAVQIFEPLARKGRATAWQNQILTAYDAAMKALAAGDANGAQAILRGLPDDAAAQRWIARLDRDPGAGIAPRALTEK
ncbi:MAG: adenylate/guanylate cyclase domain-containing protein [Ferrovibrio sp.]|uniref:adenylate/guanylate cyclase domain-containing protein n=1 Tax=Ferrovibrio sp. TaxID=1917215 RepID=UPI00391C4789